MTDTSPISKKSDLGIRALSAVVMVVVAGTAVWLGGVVWALFVAAIATGVYWEWSGLVRQFAPALVPRLAWMAGGFVYIVLAAAVLLALRLGGYGLSRTLLVLTVVVAIDVCAYAAGRTFKGPKIAPKISPSKTWSGLLGGVFGAAVVIAGYIRWFGCFDPGFGHCELETVRSHWALALVAGAPIAIIAQAGDFFESHMKRRAGVKDSGNLLPGHGGLFDRVDGLLAVTFCAGAAAVIVLGLRFAAGAPLLPA